MEQLTYEEIINREFMPDHDGCIAIARPASNGYVALTLKDQNYKPHTILCTKQDAVKLSCELDAPIENLYHDCSDRNIVVINLCSQIEHVANHMHKTICRNPSAHWMLTKPRKERLSNFGMSAAILFAIQKKDGLYRYLMRTSMIPANSLSGAHMPMAAADVYQLHYERTVIKTQLKANIESVYVDDIKKMKNIIEAIWLAGITASDSPTEPLPEKEIKTPDYLIDWAKRNELSPIQTQKLFKKWNNNYLYSGDVMWAALEAIRDFTHGDGTDPDYQTRTKSVWGWPGKSAFEI